jgi:hypothetical protein
MSEKLIALAVISQAVQDWRSKSLRTIYENDLRQFFFSVWFESLCDGVGIDPDNVRHECSGLT